MPVNEVSNQRYFRMKDDFDRETSALPSTFLEYNRAITHLSKLQILLSFVFICLSSLGDVMAFSQSSLRVYLSLEIIGIYLFVSGFLGLAASLSYRRGLLITASIMHVHTILLAMPFTIFVCVLAMVGYYSNCYYMSANDGVGTKYEMKCGNYDPDTMIHYIPVSGDIRLDLGLVVLSVLQVLLSAALAFIGFYCVFEKWGIVNEKVLHQITKATTFVPIGPDTHRSNISVIGEDTRTDNVRRAELHRNTELV